MKKNILILIFIFLNFFSTVYSNEKTILIKFKVNDDLITNYDIIKEAKYLKSLNKNLENININQLYEIAKNSLMREKIKQFEIEKYYQVNYESEVVDTIINNFMQKLNIDNKTDFEIYLSDYDTSIKEIRKKLVIEQTWNKMIFEIYKDKIIIDEKKITQTLDSLIKEKGKQKSFKLYEIVFSQKNKENFKKKYEEIISAIESLGFKEAALMYSISDTAKLSGKIGWINQNQLSKKILNEIQGLEVGSYTKPINTVGGALILQLDEIKEVDVQDIDKEKELSKIITAEKNRQLNEFSVIHFKKTENKSYVEKF